MVECSLFIINLFYIFKCKWNSEIGHLLTKISNIVQFNSKKHLLQCKVKYDESSVFLQIWKQQKAKAEAFGSRSLKLQSIDGLFEPRKFEKVKGSNIDTCKQMNFFSYLIDKIVSLRRNFSTALVILTVCSCHVRVSE